MSGVVLGVSQATGILGKKSCANTTSPATRRTLTFKAGLRRGFDAQEISLCRVAMQLAVSLNVSYIIMENVNDVCSGPMRCVWMESLGGWRTRGAASRNLHGC